MKKIIKGILEVGERDLAGPTDTSYGKTTPDGVTVTLNQNELTVESGQDTFPVDVLVTSAGSEFSGELIFATLENLARVLGIDPDAVTGDVEGDPAEKEVLAIANDAIGSRAPQPYYVKTPGRVTTRTYQITKGRMLVNGDIQLGRDQEVRLPFKIVTLATDDGSNPVEITDAVA